MSDAIALALLTAIVNGAVTWGVVSTKLAWLRRDVDQLQTRLRELEASNGARAALKTSMVLNDLHHR
jgi:hypothetical protein